MTFPPCSRFLNTCAECLLLLLLCVGSLTSCGTVSEALYPDSPHQETGATAREEKRQKVVSSQFEWAVQNYEAGEYELAISQFRKLKSLGPELPGYELVPFYLGMSLYRSGRYPEAMPELQAFLRSKPGVSEGQDARIALLSIYEHTKQWDKLLGLAAETDKLTLFQDKRAFLKLAWALALREKGENKGARAVLKDAAQYLDGHNTNRTNGPDLDQDLWGRYYYTSFLLETEECNSSPREIGTGKKRKRLYQPWLESAVDCYRDALDKLGKDLGDSGWSAPAAVYLRESIEGFGKKIQGYLAQSKGRLQTQRALEDLARQNLYRLLSKLDESLKFFKNQGINQEPLEEIRKQLDLLLVSLARPS